MQLKSVRGNRSRLLPSQQKERSMIRKIFAAVLALSLPASAQTRPASVSESSDASDFALTVYSSADPASFDPQELARQQVNNPYNRYQYRLPGYGVVREQRKINLLAGDNTLRFTDVASGIDPTTVSFESLTAPNATAVLEQNYEYDLVNFDALLSKFINKQITITRNSRTFQATLLSSDSGSLIYQEGSDPNGPVQVMARDPGAIQLPDTRGLNTKPTLVWKIRTDKPGPHDVKVTYQTDGLTWRADYNVVVNANDTKADIGAWVTLLNQSGASYPNAKLKLVAGDVQRVRTNQYMYGGGGRGAGGAAAPQSGFQEKSFFEYHLYTLGRPTSLAQNSTKQIELFPSRSDVPVTKTYVYYGLPESMRYWISPSPNQDRNLGIDSNKKVDIYLLTKNSSANGMGMPLPAGRIRVYKRDDADKTLEFIGEDVIDHTPKDEPIMIKLGSAFDVVGERKQTDFKVQYDGHWITEDFEIKIRNHKSEPIHVIIKENLFRWANWEIVQCSDKYEKQDYRTIHIPADVPQDGERTVTYSVRYTW
jgi:hypothetical protein